MALKLIRLSEIAVTMRTPHHYIVLHCSELHCPALSSTVLHCPALHALHKTGFGDICGSHGYWTALEGQGQVWLTGCCVGHQGRGVRRT